MPPPSPPVSASYATEPVNLGRGKGRKERITPLTKTTVSILRVWLAEHGSQPDQPLFTTSRSQALSRDAVQRLVAKHAATAALTCPSLAGQKVTPHTLRHTAAMALLHAGVEVTVIALWLGQEQVDTTMIYLKADCPSSTAYEPRQDPPEQPNVTGGSRNRFSSD